MNFLKKLFRKSKKESSNKPAGEELGCVTHYYSGISVAIVKFSKSVDRGTAARFYGATTDFTQSLDSMQYDHKDIASAPKGKEVGVKVKNKVREGDCVYAT